MISDADIINVITSHTSASAVPTLAVAMNRLPYNAASDAFSGPTYDLREDSTHDAHRNQPPISPRLHSLPDNVLSPLGLLAEASLQNTNTSKRHYSGPLGGKSTNRPSPLSLETSQAKHGRKGSAVSSSSIRMAISDVRSGNEVVDKHGYGGVASQNYFRPGTRTHSPPLYRLTRIAGGSNPVSSSLSQDKVDLMTPLTAMSSLLSRCRSY